MEQKSVEYYTDLQRDDLDPELFAAALAVQHLENLSRMEEANMDELAMTRHFNQDRSKRLSCVPSKTRRKPNSLNKNGVSYNECFHR